MAATNLYINWTAAKFTSTTGAVVTNILKVTDVKVNRDAQPEMFKGDADTFFRAIAVPSMKRTITVTTGDVAGVAALVQGTDGAFEVKLADALNGITTGGGGVKIALTHCVVLDNTAGGAHSKFASAQITFEGYATDGTTDPLTVTAL